MGKYKYSSTLCLNSALRGSDQLYVQALYAQARQPASIVQETGWDLGPEWMGTVNLASAEVGTTDRLALGDPLYRLSYPGQQVNQYLD
jgi:hypothetical protein